MELNGVANIIMLMDRLYKNSGELDYETFGKIENQLEMLQEYLKQVGDIIEVNQIDIPFWHDIRKKYEKS